MRDAVDEITDAWRREQPEMDVAAVGVTTRARRLVRYLDVLRTRTLEELGLNAAALDLLATLRRSGHPHRLPIVEVRRRTLVTAGAISMRIDRAEAAGWVNRVPHASDHRQTEVELTETGRDLVDRAALRIAQQEADLLSDLDADERERLDGALRRWLAAASDGRESRP